MKRTLILIALLSLCLFPPSARAEVEVEAAWSPPTYGTPVAYYTVQLEINDSGEWAFAGTALDTTLALTLLENTSYRARVAGIDADGHHGPFCTPSDPYIYGAPGEPTWGGVSGCSIRLRN